jgi:hypothetical protein
MNLKTLVKVSNVVASIAIVLLIYWVFIFISVQVFGFKIFREKLSETFALSIFGLLALMGGSLIINVMFNLTRIAERHNKDELFEIKAAFSKRLGWAFLLTFPIIFGLLFAGNYLTVKKKETMLIDSAKSVVAKYPQKADVLLNYNFGEDWFLGMNDSLEMFRKTDKNFPEVFVIVKDSIDNEDVFLAFRHYSKQSDGDDPKVKRDYIFNTGKEERDYLSRVFNENYGEVKFSASDGRYELFYPYFKDGKKIVLYFSDYQRYGKLGS